jgi:hypothetical protein
MMTCFSGAFTLVLLKNRILLIAGQHNNSILKSPDQIDLLHYFFFFIQINCIMDQTIKIGVSSCLLGKEVRYNGGHSHDRYITGTLSDYFTFYWRRKGMV